MQSPALDPYCLSIHLQQDNNQECKKADSSLGAEANFGSHRMSPIDLKVTYDEPASSYNVLVRRNRRLTE